MLVLESLVDSPLLQNCESVVSHGHVELGSNDEVFHFVGSDGPGSGIEEPPLSWVVWSVVLDSESVSVDVDFLMEEDRSSSWELRSQLELDTVGEWLLLEDELGLVKNPSLVLGVLAFEVGDWGVVSVSVPLDVHAETTVVSQIVAAAVLPSDSVAVKALVWSESDLLVVSELSVQLVANAVVSLVSCSDGLSSGIEQEPLLLISWVVVLDLHLVLVLTEVGTGVVVDCSSTGSDRFDLELDSWS